MVRQTRGQEPKKDCRQERMKYPSVYRKPGKELEDHVSYYHIGDHPQDREFDDRIHSSAAKQR
jgi:hypothetical protein